MLIPIPIKRNIPIITKDDWVKAAVIAVPTKGAEHGVANKVAKKPLKKFLVNFPFPILTKLDDKINWGNLNSKTLNILS